MGSVKELSHTADVGFELRAGGLEELFELGAEGLAAARGAPPDPSAEAEVAEVELERPDLERLLVAWLRELLHRSMQRNQVASADVLRVRRPGRDGRDAAALVARVTWRPAAPNGPEREIKGVTYHGLAVERESDGWHARVVLDV